jgi:dipeptidase
MLSQFVISIILVCFLYKKTTDACSNILVSPEASADGSTIIAYNADAASLYGSLYHYPKSDNVEGTMRKTYDWDTGAYLGEIPEVSHTYNVVGNINQFGLIIGETTYGGLSNLQSQKGALIDYGSLIWITLQRSRNAREAINTIGKLLADYGYASEGESFSIADNNEAWVMEIIGKGDYEKGAVWIARKLPPGAVCSHANQARITQFPLNDPDNCLYAPDVIDFARKLDLYHGSDENFSFSDTYDPISFSGARFCEARVWSFFSSVMGQEWSDQYADYASGYNLTNRMPLFVTPATGKISVANTMQYMRSHYEGTSLDMTGTQFPDVGAMYSNSPMRTHPLTWSSNGNEYLNERPIATPQTGWGFCAQSRKWMPAELSGLLWFGPDESSTTPHAPFYGSSTRVPESYAGKGPQDGVVPPLMTFSFDSAFYVYNLVANFAYTRWDLIYNDVIKNILSIEAKFESEIAELDMKALKVYQTNKDEAVELVTNYSVQTGNALVKDWLTFFGSLFVKYRDGYVITKDESELSCGCKPVAQNNPQPWNDRVVAENGDHFRVPDSEFKKSKFSSTNKIDLLNRH